MRFATVHEAATVRAVAERDVKRARGALIDYMHSNTARVATIDRLALDLADALDVLDIVNEAET